MAEKRFTATIEAGARGGAFVRLPFDAEAVFGSARPKVRVTFDGEPYRGTIARMSGDHLLGIVKGIRGKIGKDVGDDVKVVVELDTAPRTVEVPPELARALRRRSGARAAFDALSHTKRKEICLSVSSAKKDETRRRRADRAVAAIDRSRR